MRRKDVRTNVKDFNAEISIEIATTEGWKLLGTKQIHSIDEVIRNYDASFRIAMFINNIVVTDDVINQVEADETFFYASVEAAKNGKVWCEEVHEFVDPSWKSEFQSGCFDFDGVDPNEEALFWIDIRTSIENDINGYMPVTGKDGHAIIRDEDLANKCKEWGYDVLPCGNPEHLLEDGTPDEWWMIFTKGGEEGYFSKTYNAKAVSLDAIEDEDINELLCNFPEDQDDFDPDYEGTLHYKNGKWMKDEEYASVCRTEAKKFVEAHREELRDAFTRMAVIGYLSGI